MAPIFIRFAKDESGVTALEYGLIVGLVTVFIISGIRAVGQTIAANFYGPIAAAFS